MIMQLLTRNPFVEPATAGTMEAAGLGILLMTIAQPHAPVVARMLAGAVCAVLGTGLFLAVLSRLALRDLAMVPVVGLVLGGVLSAFVGALVMTPVAVWAARHPSGPPALVSFMPAFWLLVPGALGLLGLTKYLGEDRVPRLETAPVVLGTQQGRHGVEHPGGPRTPRLCEDVALGRPGPDAQGGGSLGGADPPPDGPVLVDPERGIPASAAVLVEGADHGAGPVRPPHPLLHRLHDRDTNLRL